MRAKEEAAEIDRDNSSEAALVPKNGDDNHRDHDIRDRIKDVISPHDQVVDKSPVETGKRAEHKPNDKTDQNASNADRQRIAGAPHNPRQDIAAHIVTAKDMLQARLCVNGSGIQADNIGLIVINELRQNSEND